jgi:hypothetical protein
LPKLSDSAWASVFRWWHETQPGRVGAGKRRRHDLDHVAVLEFGAQGHLLTIDPGGHGAVADIAVDGVGKVHHGGPAGQRQDLALRGEHIDGVRVEIHLDVVPELGGIAGLALDVQQRLEPLVAKPLGVGCIRVAGLVEPMGRHTRFSHQVHGLGAQLELDVDARRTDQCRVQ